MNETAIGKSSRNQGKHLLFNIAWLMIFLTVAIIYSRFAPFRHYSPWYFALLFDFGPFLGIQAIFHWVALRHLFYNQKRKNIFWVVFMPVLLMAGFASAAFVDIFFSPKPV